jgi:hypothetical protein
MKGQDCDNGKRDISLVKCGPGFSVRSDSKIKQGTLIAYFTLDTHYAAFSMVFGLTQSEMNMEIFEIC